MKDRNTKEGSQIMKKREVPVMNVGISLIILIFMNICLAAFAVLSLENALSDYSLSKKTAEHTTQYYKAVNKIQEQLAEKNQELVNREKNIHKNGQTLAKKQLELTEEVSKRQQLSVVLQLDETGRYPQYYIKKWKLCSSDDWQADDSLDVYQR